MWRELLAKLFEILHLNELVKLMFVPPAPPDLDLGYLAKATGVIERVADAVRTAYFAGVQDGLMWGFVLALILVHVLPKLNIVKSLNNAINSIL